MNNEIKKPTFLDFSTEPMTNAELETVSAKTCLDGTIALLIDRYNAMHRCDPDAGEAWGQGSEAQEERRVAWRSYKRTMERLGRRILSLQSVRHSVIDGDIAYTCEQRGKAYDQLERDVTHFSVAKHTFTEGKHGQQIKDDA